jgi:hypothetical protein
MSAEPVLFCDDASDATIGTGAGAAALVDAVDDEDDEKPAAALA